MSKVCWAVLLTYGEEGMRKGEEECYLGNIASRESMEPQELTNTKSHHRHSYSEQTVFAIWHINKKECHNYTCIKFALKWHRSELNPLFKFFEN